MILQLIPFPTILALAGIHRESMHQSASFAMLDVSVAIRSKSIDFLLLRVGFARVSSFFLPKSSVVLALTILLTTLTTLVLNIIYSINLGMFFVFQNLSYLASSA